MPNTSGRESVFLIVKVIPRASRSEIAGLVDGVLRVRLKAPPVDGAANDELIRILARALGTSRTAVEIVSGHASRTKKLRITGISPEKLAELLGHGQ
jgi:uncharacterized protein